MRNFEILTANRDAKAWALAKGESPKTDIAQDRNLTPMESPLASRGANEWLSPADELKAFRIDPRFEVNLFASEEEFPDIACPIQMRWDARGRLGVACSTTYPHIYPGQEPRDKIVILEDTDWDGKAVKSTVWADMVERMVDVMAHELGEDPADFSLKNFIRPDQFPYKSATGWEYDSGNYEAALKKAMDMIDYRALRQEQAEKCARGELMGIGILSFTEVVGAGPAADFDILGIKMMCTFRCRSCSRMMVYMCRKSRT